MRGEDAHVVGIVCKVLRREQSNWRCELLKMYISVGADSFLGMQRIFCSNFQSCPKNFYGDKHSPFKFSVADGTLYFPLPNCHRLENWNLVLEVCFLTAQLRKS